MRRFDGKVSPLARIIDISGMVEWISAIPFEQWPQQSRLPDGQIRPAMVNDLSWHGFGRVSDPITAELMGQFPGHKAYNRMVSVVMPGADIYPHADRQAPDWICRVHVPLVTNEHSAFVVEGERFAMRVGTAYLVNTEREHEVRNDGPGPRIHFMFDVRPVSS